VLIGMLLWSDRIDDGNSITLRLINYISTGGQLYRWSRDETGPGQEISPEWWDSLAYALDRGHWDFSQLVTDFLQGRRGTL